MSSETSQQQALAQANKLIFVKEYKMAFHLLQGKLTPPRSSDAMLLLLRYVELAERVDSYLPVKNNLKKLKGQSKEPFEQKTIDLLESFQDYYSGRLSAGDFQEQIAKCLGQTPFDAFCYYFLGFAYENEGQTEKAISSYLESIRLDQDCYPSYFGLSQLYYSAGQTKNGDYYFYLFEKYAPFNIYGNVDTHQNLLRDFLETSDFELARKAVTTLSEWWSTNKGLVPQEVQLLELLSLRMISEQEGNRGTLDAYTESIRDLALNLLGRETILTKVLMFAAKILDQYKEKELSLSFYRRILREDLSDRSLLHKIAGHFFATQSYEEALRLFSEAKLTNPDSEDIDFCLLVSRLKASGVKVEPYLLLREQFQHLDASDINKVIALGEELLHTFAGDAKVHAKLAEAFLKAGKRKSAKKHYDLALGLDNSSKELLLPYARFAMEGDEPEKGLQILKRLETERNLTPEERLFAASLKSIYYLAKRSPDKALEFIEECLKMEPWNVSYLAVEGLALLKAQNPEFHDADLSALKENKSDKIQWTVFDEKTHEAIEQGEFRLAYTRLKLRYLFADGEEQVKNELVSLSEKYDPEAAIFDLTRLINTNFDTPFLYHSIADLYQEIGLMESAASWFQLELLHPLLSETSRPRTYLKLADCYNWLNRDLTKALEYARLSSESGLSPLTDTKLVEAHSLLRMGKVAEAERVLRELEKQLPTQNTLEYNYLLGLLSYRNGQVEKAKSIWKPVLKVPASSHRDHRLKQEMLAYYYDNEPYQLLEQLM